MPLNFVYSSLEFDNPERPECRNLLSIYQIITGKSKEVSNFCMLAYYPSTWIWSRVLHSSMSNIVFFICQDRLISLFFRKLLASAKIWTGEHSRLPLQMLWLSICNLFRFEDRTIYCLIMCSSFLLTTSSELNCCIWHKKMPPDSCPPVNYICLQLCRPVMRR